MMHIKKCFILYIFSIIWKFLECIIAPNSSNLCYIPIQDFLTIFMSVVFIKSMMSFVSTSTGYKGHFEQF